ncbi:MAG: tyrosine--tRNA ligase [cyanobacterium endosymbiont of Rhopalodia musculus]|uniref:tyrosine--tRNA ligase n=1 Tax=cyanobacterium endosymbiont of Epithemia clementina EcSB TaxID=3034674 RepID=UPI0024818023|nr:tyrosine--tRNA ligase [cyanobacterium endosymbiont of Epithemia clementina EcSB]WGT67683.1 tyrosine--tRNA ligase [cyanobacterium endosymbiont of Epithemia clementina EcSB]
MSPVIPSKSLAWLYRGTHEIFPHQPNSDNSEENLEQYLKKCDHPLRVKLGIDPTGSTIHLGHSIPFRKLRAFQDAGHTAVIIIGDFTAQIGDPTGRSEVRKQLTPEQVQENARNYLEQLSPILDFETPGRLEIHYNSEWLKELNLTKIQELLATMTVGQMLAKEGFAERFKQENPVFLHEFLYPLMQGYDSVMIDADVELGGTDQKFNIAVGRDLQRYFGKPPQFGLLLPILIGTDGHQKMSKSLNNYVGLKENALSMYSKLEKIPDTLIRSYFELLTKLPLDNLPKNPRDCQKQLGIEIVSQFHGKEAAVTAQKTAEELVKKRNGTSIDIVAEYDLSGVEFPAKLFYILNASGLCSSSGEGRRQLQGGAVRLDGDRVTDVNLSFETVEELQGKILQVGKKKFVRLI